MKGLIIHNEIDCKSNYISQMLLRKGLNKQAAMTAACFDY
ncbi:hypothetical protein VAS14_04943 [Photobacterium angustum S14]|uniref:Uncharacterized protein n=1 Tax=Photobacterium angustum (strain S14 / CCUG 15956) TaxID=314292 RepID=Q1ZSD9_PHOAS|nr:hypothetical protein VAS14_04943 [Photobacterium angustum S14]